MSVMTAPSAGLERLPTLPIFFKLAGRRVILAGGEEPAVWKAEVLAAAGALVDVVAEEHCAGLEALAQVLGENSLRLTRRSWQPADLTGAALAIGAIEDEEQAEAFRRAAGVAGVPVNIIDKPAFCEFQFGTIIARSPVVIAITTDARRSGVWAGIAGPHRSHPAIRAARLGASRERMAAAGERARLGFSPSPPVLGSLYRACLPGGKPPADRSRLNCLFRRGR